MVSVFDIIPNNTFSRAELSDTGSVKNIHYGDILVKFGDTLDVENTISPYIKDGKSINRTDVFLKDGDIITEI